AQRTDQDSAHSHRQRPVLGRPSRHRVYLTVQELVTRLASGFHLEILGVAHSIGGRLCHASVYPRCASGARDSQPSTSFNDDAVSTRSVQRLSCSSVACSI